MPLTSAGILPRVAPTGLNLICLVVELEYHGGYD